MIKQKIMKSDEELSDEKIEELITDIVRLTRTHPLVRRGAGLRGSIAFKDIMESLKLLYRKKNRVIIEKSALITLPHRISLKFGCERAPKDIVREIIQKVLYTYSLKVSEEELKKILRGLLETTLNSDETEFDPDTKELPPLNPDLMNFSEFSPEGTYQDNLEAFNNLLKAMEEEDLLQMTDAYKYTFTDKAIQMLLEDLEERYQQGEITESEYLKVKEKLRQASRQIMENPLTLMDEDILSNVMAEIMDLQDKFGSSVKFNDIFAHYIIKSNKGEEVEPDLVDYRKLQVIVHVLNKEGLIKLTDEEKKSLTKEAFYLDDEAFTWLLFDFISKAHLKEIDKDLLEMRADSEKIDVRKYKPGDVFRDISVPQTMKQIIKQKKILEDVKKKDLRAFIREPVIPLSIVLAIDVSHSMGFESKLRYARIAAVVLAKEAIEMQDKIAIVAFSNFGEVITPMVSKINPIMDSLLSLKATQYTNIGDAIKVSRELLRKDRRASRKHIILLTDGEPTAASEGISRNVSMDERKVIGEAYAIQETEKTVSKGINVSIVHINKEDTSIKFAEKIRKIGKGYLIKVKTAEEVPKKVLEVWKKAKLQ